MVKSDKGEIEIVGSYNDVKADITTLLYAYSKQLMKTLKPEFVTELIADVSCKAIEVAISEYLKDEDEQCFFEKPKKKKHNSKFKRGDKFEIEIAEVHTHYDDNGKPFSMYRAKGFSTLTFDDKGLERLRKIESEDK